MAHVSRPLCPVTASPVTNTAQKGCLATTTAVEDSISLCYCVCRQKHTFEQRIAEAAYDQLTPPTSCHNPAQPASFGFCYHWRLLELLHTTMDLALQIAAAAVVAVLALALILSRRSSYKSHVQQLQPKKKRQLVIGTWTREELAKHRTVDDLWVTIQDQGTKEWKVYDLTDYVDDHPGGMAIMYNAGGDATKGFHGPQHPSTVHELAKDYCIGTLADP